MARDMWRLHRGRTDAEEKGDLLVGQPQQTSCTTTVCTGEKRMRFG